MNEEMLLLEKIKAIITLLGASEIEKARQQFSFLDKAFHSLVENGSDFLKEFTVLHESVRDYCNGAAESRFEDIVNGYNELVFKISQKRKSQA